MPRKTFMDGDVLPASDLNLLMNQSVMTFSTSAARTTAISTPTEGMVTYLEDSDLISIYESGAWRTSLNPRGGILQVQSTTKTDAFTMASSTFADVTGLSVSITPKSSSSRVLVNVSLSGGGNPGASALLGRIMRDSTAIVLCDAAGSRTRTTFGNIPSADGSNIPSNSFTFLDSPASTSALVYKVQVANNGASTVFVNRSPADVDGASWSRAASSITVMEVSA
jgi:hypothetical protein